MTTQTPNPRELARDLVSRLGISPGYASDLANGNRSPSLEIAVRAEDELKIPPRWWLKRKAA